MTRFIIFVCLFTIFLSTVSYVGYSNVFNLETFTVDGEGKPFEETLDEYPPSTTSPVSATGVQLPAVYPLVNILLPLLNNVYNLLLSLLSIFDTLPPSISCVIPVDLGALETSLLKLYSQALAIVNFLRSLPEYAIGANPSSPPAGVANVQGLLSTLVSTITDLADDVLIGIGGGLLPGLLQLVVMVVQALLALLL